MNETNTRKLEKWLQRTRTQQAAKPAEAQAAPAQSVAAMTEKELIEALRRGRGLVSVKDVADDRRTPEVCTAAVQQNGRAIEFLTPEQCAQPLVSGWIMENWGQCARVLGKERAQESTSAAGCY